MPVTHVVWDWNGTLLDDLDIVIESVNVCIARFEMGPIDEDGYRDHFTRPVRSFYDSLFGRPVTDMEWGVLNKSFHEEYFGRVHRARLTEDAVDAIELASGLGWTQSLLSMTTHEMLLEIVSSHGLEGRFIRIDGLTGPTGGMKSLHLRQHLTHLDLPPDGVAVVGDTPDDAAAAIELGAMAILYDGGSHHLPVLGMTGAPVAHNLISAVELAR